jgi:hypothetical protein
VPTVLGRPPEVLHFPAHLLDVREQTPPELPCSMRSGYVGSSTGLRKPQGST